MREEQKVIGASELIGRKEEREQKVVREKKRREGGGTNRQREETEFARVFAQLRGQANRLD